MILRRLRCAMSADASGVLRMTAQCPRPSFGERSRPTVSVLDQVDEMIDRNRRLWTRAVALTALLGIPASAMAQDAPRDGAPETTVPAAAHEAIGQLWSPYCPGLMLEVCTSGGGAALRDSIAAQARAGLGAGEIVEFWVARYGEEYRATPKFEGAGSFAWITPYVMLLAGLVVAVVVAMRRRSGPGRTASPVVTPEDTARVQAALADLDRAEAPDY